MNSEKQQQQQNLVSLPKAIFNMSKAAVGLGTILLITSMQTLGFGYGVIAMLFSAALSSLTLHFLGRVTLATRAASYSAVSAAVLGRKGEVLTGVSLGLMLFGSLMGYSYFIGQYSSSGIAFLTGKQLNGKILSSVILYLVVFPVSCMKDMSKLGVVSIFGMLIMCFIAALTIYNSLSTPGIMELIKSHYEDEKINPEYLVKFQDFPAIFPPLTLASVGCFGSLAFAFTNHFALVGTVNTLERPTKTRLTVIIGSCTIVTALINILIGVFSLRFYKNTIVLDILDRPVMNNAFAFAKIGVSFSLSFTFPLLLHPLRNLIDPLFARLIPKRPARRHYLETLLIVTVPLLVVLAFETKVNGILDVISSLFRVLLVYVLPALMILKLPRAVPGMSLKTWERYMAYLVLLFGGIICIIGPIFPFLKLIKRAPKNESLVSFLK